MTKLYQFVRSVHRLLVMVIVVMIVSMALTGSALKYTTMTLKLFPKLDLVQLRYVHNQLSPYFTGALGLMALTGLGMYILPPLIRRRARRQQSVRCS
ncbi:MAG: hypothetical protein V1907_02090 [Candidatus Kerfeldbacteria bacterium]